jgi:hypothetical protein
MKSADGSNRNIRCSPGFTGKMVHIRVPSNHPFTPRNKPVRVSAAVKAVKGFIAEHSAEIFTLEIEGRM